MKQQTSIRIATPCHEDWNAMTPAQGGKFCASCSKQVVDFTLMSDAQILKFLSTHNSGLCGRFDAAQLERPLAEPTVNKKRSWYLALVLPLSLLFQKSFGQKNPKITGAPVVMVENKPLVAQEFMKGKIKPPSVVPDSVTVHGILRDDYGKPVSYASVVIKGTSHGTTSDTAGRFSIRLKRDEDLVVLVASAVGYETVEKAIPVAEADSEQPIILAVKEMWMGEVVVTSYPHRKRKDTIVDTSTRRTIKNAEKRDSAMRRILCLNPLTVSPNPAQSGGTIHLNFRQAGAYEVQLLNNASTLLKAEMMHVSNSNTPSPFQLPQLPAGIYYLRLVSRDKNPYIEKILVN